MVTHNHGRQQRCFDQVAQGREQRRQTAEKSQAAQAADRDMEMDSAWNKRLFEQDMLCKGHDLLLQ